MTMPMRHILFVSIVSVLGACGGGSSLSPRAACEQVADVLCERLYACYTATELMQAGYPATEGECVTQTRTMSNCAAETEDTTCDAGQTYNADAAGDCVDEIGGLTCAQITDQNTDIDMAAPSCNLVCS